MEERRTGDVVESALELAEGVAPVVRTGRPEASAEQFAQAADRFVRKMNPRLLDARAMALAGPPTVEVAPRLMPVGPMRAIGRPSTGIRQMQTWPNRTELPCWNCEEGFDTTPLPLVKSHEPKLGMFTVEGNFCSLECILRHATDRYGRAPQFADMIMLTKTVLHLDFGLDPAQMRARTAAPDPKKTLARYNPEGGLTVAEYRRGWLSADCPVPLQEPPFLSYGVVLLGVGGPVAGVNPSSGNLVVLPSAGQDSLEQDRRVLGRKRPAGVAFKVPGSASLDGPEVERIRNAMATVRGISDADLANLPANVARVVRADLEKGFGVARFPVAT